MSYEPVQQVMSAKLATRKECETKVAAARASKIEAEDLMRGAQVREKLQLRRVMLHA